MLNRSLNVKLGPRRKYHKVRAAIRHYANQPALVGAFSVITNLRMDIFEALILTADGRVTAQVLPSQNKNVTYYYANSAGKSKARFLPEFPFCCHMPHDKRFNQQRLIAAKNNL